MDAAYRAFSVGSGFIFGNHINFVAIVTETSNKVCRIFTSRVDDNLRARIQNPEAPMGFIYKGADGARSLYIIVEYKPTCT